MNETKGTIPPIPPRSSSKNETHPPKEKGEKKEEGRKTQREKEKEKGEEESAGGMPAEEKEIEEREEEREEENQREKDEEDNKGGETEAGKTPGSTGKEEVSDSDATKQPSPSLPPIPQSDPSPLSRPEGVANKTRAPRLSRDRFLERRINRSNMINGIARDIWDDGEEGESGENGDEDGDVEMTDRTSEKKKRIEEREKEKEKERDEGSDRQFVAEREEYMSLREARTQFNIINEHELSSDLTPETIVGVCKEPVSENANTPPIHFKTTDLGFSSGELKWERKAIVYSWKTFPRMENVNFPIYWFPKKTQLKGEESKQTRLVSANLMYFRKEIGFNLWKVEGTKRDQTITDIVSPFLRKIEIEDDKTLPIYASYPQNQTIAVVVLAIPKNMMVEVLKRRNSLRRATRTKDKVWKRDIRIPNLYRESSYIKDLVYKSQPRKNLNIINHSIATRNAIKWNEKRDRSYQRTLGVRRKGRYFDAQAQTEAEKEEEEYEENLEREKQQMIQIREREEKMKEKEKGTKEPN